MAHRVCPWWLGYFLACRLRRIVQDPIKILGPFVQRGMTVLEPGSGMGFFTLDLARLVGSEGRVIAVDVQPRMLNGLRRRAVKAGLLDRISLKQAQVDRMGVDELEGAIDFVLAFAVVHELPDPKAFFAESCRLLKTGSRLLFVEPRGHVRQNDFIVTLKMAENIGYRIESRPSIPRSRSAVLVKTNR
ncbi:MAG TPA: class I SAM-dependent methyltransferase [Terriglobia bacterium]|nr:class I SAM-dependent methyltransferase [Terriglobia bacterium]